LGHNHLPISFHEDDMSLFRGGERIGNVYGRHSPDNWIAVVTTYNGHNVGRDEKRGIINLLKKKFDFSTVIICDGLRNAVAF
jgi:hypothetical protein